MTLRVVGLDLSLTSTGVASKGWTDRILMPATKIDGLLRLRAIRSKVMDFVRSSNLVVIEGIAYDSKSPYAAERAGLWWMVMDAVDSAGVPTAVVTTGGVKKYATGKGTAAKPAVLAAVVRRFTGYELTTTDEADALVLAAMGYDHLGCPLVQMPATHRVALDAVKWPEAVTAT